MRERSPRSLCSLEAKLCFCNPISDFLCQWLPGLWSFYCWVGPLGQNEPLLVSPHLFSPNPAYDILVFSWLCIKRGMWWSWLKGAYTRWSPMKAALPPLPFLSTSCADVLVHVLYSNWILFWGCRRFRAVVLWVRRWRLLRTETALGSNLGQVWQRDFWTAWLNCSDGLKTSNCAESHAPGR